MAAPVSRIQQLPLPLAQVVESFCDAQALTALGTTCRALRARSLEPNPQITALTVKKEWFPAKRLDCPPGLKHFLCKTVGQGLRSLTIEEGAYLTNSDLEGFAPHWPRLEHFFGPPRITFRESAILDLAEKCPRLKTLHVRVYTYMTGTYMTCFDDSLLLGLAKRCSQLTSVSLMALVSDFYGSDFQVKVTARGIHAFMQSCPQLRELKLGEFCSLMRPSVEALSRECEGIPNLRLHLVFQKPAIEEEVEVAWGAV